MIFASGETSCVIILATSSISDKLISLVPETLNKTPLAPLQEISKRGELRAFLAASLALLAVFAFSNINFATEGVSSKYSLNFSFVKLSTIPLISELPSFVLVCPSN